MDIFGILENCWVYQQKCWVPQAIPIIDHLRCAYDNLDMGFPLHDF